MDARSGGLMPLWLKCLLLALLIWAVLLMILL
jgi:hypothetical protein